MMYLVSYHDIDIISIYCSAKTKIATAKNQNQDGDCQKPKRRLPKTKNQDGDCQKPKTKMATAKNKDCDGQKPRW